MRVLVTGIKGQLGHDVMIELERQGHIGIGIDIEDLDITDEPKVREYITNANVDAVVHCAAYTAVDAAEDNQDICYKVNTDGALYIANVCKELDIKYLFLSTDYVFDGMGERPWEPNDDRSPLNVYGESKYRAEVAIEKTLEKYFIVRISWVFGINGHNFIKTMLRLAESHDTITVVNDQIGSPTYTEDLARLLVDMIQTEEYGIYHASNEGYCSWYEFAVEIFKIAGIDVNVVPVTSAEYPASKAKRPFNSRLNKSRLDEKGFKRLPSWQDATTRYIQELNKINGK